MTWIEGISKARPEDERVMAAFFGDFQIEEIRLPVARRAAALGVETLRLNLLDVIQAAALMGNRLLVTRNTRDFPASMPGIRVPYTLQ